MNMLITDSKSFIAEGNPKKLVEIRCDSISDVTPADASWAVGSIAWDITAKKIYGLKSDGTWVEQEA